MNKKTYLSLLLWLFSVCVIAQTANKQTPDLAFNHQYDSYFQTAYANYPNIPRGLLEAIAYTNTRIYHLSPTPEHSSCMGLPAYYGVMGLVENGKGWFRNNLLSAAQTAHVDANLMKQSPEANILAFADYINNLIQQNNATAANPLALAQVIRLASELPYNQAHAANDFAMNSHLYSVFYFLNNTNFQAAYQLPKYQFNLKQIFGDNYGMVTANQLDLTQEFGHNTTNNTPQLQQLVCTMPTGPKEYSAAVTFDAPDPANYSTVTIAPYTIAIHDVEGTYASCISWFNNPAAVVSAHYVMRSFDGQVTQMVCHRNRAYHVAAENSYAVGIEHEGFEAQGEVWYTNAMYQSSANLCKFIASDLGINKLQTYDGPPISGLSPMSHTCTKIKGHQMFPNNSHSDPGPGWDWPRFYKLINDVMPTPTVSTATAGTVYDSGGSAANYTDEERSTWLIQPTGGASAITLTFTAWTVENTYDYLWIYDGTNENGALIGKYSGTSPGSVTAYSGAIFMEFRSDCATNQAGWAANYTSTTAAAACPIPTTLAATTTALTANLSWAAVSGVSAYEVSFKRTTASTWSTYTATTNSYVATGLTAGASYEWRVRSACSGATYSGYAGATFVTTDAPTTQIGTGAITVNQCEGVFKDSGGSDWNYNHYEDWTYTIAPIGSTGVTLTFSSFNIEANYDYLRIYNGPTTASPLIGTYTGTTSPGTVTASSGVMTLRFTSDNATYAAGWAATWTCVAAPSCTIASTVNTISGFKTDDFTANFTDNACTGTATRFYQVQDYNQTDWRCNANAGFFNDSFIGTTLNTEWTSNSGTWSNSSNTLYQADDATPSGDNTNIYTPLTQTNNATYLYSWSDMISGTGTNRRAGLHWFCDDATQSNRGNSYFIYYRVDNDKMQLYKVTANVFTMVLEVAATVDPNVWYTHKVLYNPTTGKVDIYRNNTFIGTWTDTAPLTSGNSISVRSGNCKYNVDNLQVFKSRSSTTAPVSLGTAAADMVRYQSPNATTNSGQISTLLLSNNTWTNTDTKGFLVDWTAPSTTTVNDGTAADVDITTSANTLSANWAAATDANSGITTYEYSIGTTAGATNTLAWTSNGTATAFTQTGLSLSYGQSYYVNVRATNGAGLTSISSSDGIQLPCDMVSNLAVSSITTTSATITWTAVSGATSYGIRYRIVGAATWITTTSTTNTLALSSLTSSSNYEVQVATTCASGTSAYTTSSNFTTLTPCNTPTGVTVSSITTTSASVTWTAVSGASSYTVQYRAVGTTVWTSVVSSVTTVTLSSLSSTTQYEVQVATTCASGTSAYTTSSNFTTLTPCNTPTGVTVSSITTTSASVTWTAVSGASSYTVQYRAVGTTVWTSVVSSVTTVTLSSLSSTTQYEVQVATTCASGTSAYTASTNFTTLTPCNTPTGVAVSSITTTSASVTWTAVSGATSYGVRYRIVGAATWITTTSTTNTLALSSLTSSSNYEVQVATVCASGTSAYTASTNFTTLTSCGVPTNVAVSNITATGATVTWTAVSGATSYTVRYRIIGAASWSSTTVTTNTKVFTSITSSANYEVQVRSVCASGNSAYTASVTFTTLTPCGVPTGLFTNQLTTTDAKVNWTAVSSATSYTIQRRAVGSATWLSTTSTVNYKYLGGFTACTNYEWRVRATCPSGTSAYTAVNNFTTTGCGASPMIADNTTTNMSKTDTEILTQLTLQPNPARDYAELLYDTDIATNVILTISDVTGKTISQETRTVTEGNNRLSLDLSNLQRGYYLVMINNPTQIKMQTQYARLVVLR